MQSNVFVGKKIDEYILTNVLGTGAFGQVFQAQNLTTNQTVAIKAVPKTKLYFFDNIIRLEHKGLVGTLLQTEVSVLMECNNKNVVKMLKYLESENNCYLVMEFCNQGDLEQLWKSRNRIIPEKEAIAYMKQILNGMKALHEMNVLHRDIKLANIIIHNSILKLADLGFAKRLTDNDQLIGTALGTLGNMAPEVIEHKLYGILADMFSLGTIYYQMLFGVLPFSIKDYDHFLKDVINNKPNFARGGMKISEESQDLLGKMLQYDPRFRMKWDKIYDHPVFTEGKRGQGISNQMTISQMAAGQVDMKKNKDLYQQNQQKMEIINDQNMMDMIKQNKPTQQPQKIQEEQNYQQDNQQIEKAREQIKVAQNKEEEINQTIEKYLGLRNSLVFLARLLDEIHKIKHSEHTNVFLPAFLLTKKLLLENSLLLQQIQGHQNLFNCQYVAELYNNQLFINLISTLKEEQCIIMDHLNIILNQCKDIFSKMQNPNPKLTEELSQYASPNFQENLKDTLINYYFQLQEEISGDEQGNKISNLCIFVLDALAYDKVFKKEMQNPIFNLDTYFDQFGFKTDQELDKLREEKFSAVF